MVLIITMMIWNRPTSPPPHLLAAARGRGTDGKRGESPEVINYRVARGTGERTWRAPMMEVE